MVPTADIHSLRDYQRHAKAYIQHVTQTKHPVAVTVNGAAEVVVQDAGEYHQMVDRLDRSRLIEAIRAGEEDMAAGHTTAGDEMFDALGKELGISD